MTRTTIILLDSGSKAKKDVCQKPKVKDIINNLSAWLNLATTVLSIVLRIMNLR